MSYPPSNPDPLNPPPVLTYHQPPAMLHPATIIVELVEALRQILWVVILFVVLRFTTGRGSAIEIVLAAFALLRVLRGLVLYFTVRYAIDAGVLSIRSGLLFIQRRTIPLDRIQNVVLKQPFLHRLMGVVTVSVETASGSGAEAELSVLDLPTAHRVREKLLAEKSGRGAAGVVDVYVAPEAPPVYRASLGMLILAGATQTRVGAVIAGIFGFIFWLDQASESDATVYKRIGGVAADAGVPIATAMAAALIILFLAGWLVSIATSVITHFDFRLSLEGDRLKRRWGMFTRNEDTFPKQRLQLLKLEQPILQRLIGFGRVIAETAGSYEDKKEAGRSQLCPIVRRSEATGIARFALAPVNFDGIEFRRVSPKAVRIGTVRAGFGLAVLVGGLSAALSWKLMFLMPVVILAALILSYLRYRALGYQLTDELLYVRWGIFKRTIAVVPRGKVQSVAVVQGPLIRRLGIAHLEVMTATWSMGADVTVPDLPQDIAIGLANELAKLKSEATTNVVTPRAVASETGYTPGTGASPIAD